ncbi:hypothetical protein KFK09_006786 [Dendrobium nobile]|uniref:Cation/H+ exchanger domain-containing protein n=1 Tax=Dendrobium nobile TaxID=94219 RepID=A0A8T3BQ79_DENNO|nr:hypothetical protein KFK09_006786 [Dendrobium nobile]
MDDFNLSAPSLIDIWSKRVYKNVSDGSFDLPDLDFVDVSIICLDLSDERSSIIYSFEAYLENPFTFSLPTIVLQIVLITIMSRVIYYILRPIKQPRVVCDIIAGILLSPSLIDLIFPEYLYIMYPDNEMHINRTLAAFGLMFYLFLIGVKMDPKIVLKSGKKAILIGLVSSVIPFSLVGTAAYFFRTSIDVGIARGKFLIFLVATLTITAFPVVSDILTELNLLNSELGRLAMSVSMVHGILGWFFMALFTALNQSQGGLSKAARALGSVLLMVCVIVFCFRPWMLWVARRTPKGGRVSSLQLHSIVVSVIVMGLVSEMTGASFANGPLIMGLMVPEGPPLGTDLVERIGNMANEVIMPLVFTAAGAVMTPLVVLHLRRWMVLIMLVLMAYGSKLLATIGPAMYCKISFRKAFILGLMMNFQGVIELITYMNFQNGSLLDDESYTLLVFTIIIITSVATPLVKHLYNPLGHDLVGRRDIQHLRTDAEIRILACLLNEDHIPSILGLLEAASPTTPICVYVLHLVELTGRANSTLIAHKNKKGFINPSNMDRLHNAFIHYEQSKQGIVAIQPFTTIAPFKTMHQDICSLAGDKSAAIIILPLPGKDASGGFSEQDQAFRTNIPHILSKAPCSVGLLVHMGLTVTVLSTPANFQHHIGLLFWGGPDDRESLSYAARMARHTGVTLTVTRFFSSSSMTSNEKEAQMDNEVIETFRKENSDNLRASMNEVFVNDMEQTISAIRNFSRVGYDLIMVGRRLSWNSILNDELEEWSEFPELGVVGDIIASSDFESEFLILVVQQGP